MTDTRKQVEREIAEWLRRNKLLRQMHWAAVIATAIERGEYRKDEA